MEYLYTLEIDSSGLVRSVSLPEDQMQHFVFPSIGENMAMFWDNETNLVIGEYLKNIFQSYISIEFVLPINGQHFQCTSVRHGAEKAFLCLKPKANNNGAVNINITQDQSNHEIPSFINEHTSHPFSDKVNITGFAFKNMATAIILIDKKGHFYDFNEAAPKMFGYTSEEFKNINIAQIDTLISEEERKLFRNELREEKKKSLFKKLKKKDGSLIEVELNSNHLIFEGTEIDYAFVTELTEKRISENELEYERTLLRKLIDTLPFPVFIKDAEARKRICNKEDMEMLMQKDAINEVIGKTDLEIFKGKPDHIGYEQDMRVLATKQPIIEEKETFYTKDNQKFEVVTTKMPTFDKKGTVTGLVGFCMDVTEKNKIEAKIKLADFSFKNVSVGIIYLCQDGRIHSFNDAFHNLFGYIREEFEQFTIFNFDSKFTAESYIQYWEKVKETGSFTFVGERRRKDGFTLTLEITPNFIKFGEVELICSFVRDITEQKKLEKQLQLVDFSFKNAATSILLLLPDSTFFDFNDAILNLLGYTKEEMRQLTLSDIDPTYDKNNCKENWVGFRKIKRITLEKKIRKKDGRFIEVETRNNLITYDELEINFCFITDISEKKKLENRLKLVDYAFRKTATPTLMLNKDGSSYDFNEAICKMLGYTHEEFKGLTLFDFSRHTPESWEPRWEELKEKGFLYNISKLKRKDGTWVDVEIRADMFHYGDITVCCSSTIDITQKKKAEDDLIRSNQRYENAIIATSEVVWEWDLLNNTNYYSQNFTTLFGYPILGPESGLDNSWRRNLHPEDIQRVLDNEAECLKGVKDKWEIEYRLKKADGGYAIVHDRGFVIKDEKGIVAKLIGAMQDITIRKEEEERLQLVNFIFKKVSTPVIISNEYGMFTDLNQAACDLYGYTMEEMIVLGIDDIRTQKKYGYKELWDIVKTQKQYNWENIHKKKDGSLINVEIKARFFEYKGNEFSCTFIEDITEKKKAVETLQKSFERFENATIATSDVVWEADLIQKTYYSSKNFTLLFGHKSAIYEDLEDNEWSKNVHQEDLKKVLEETENILKNKETTWRKEYRLRKANGEYALVLDKGFLVKDENGQPVRLVGALRDITKRKEEEERIKLFETVIINTTEAVIIRDAKNKDEGGLPILYVNNAFTKMTGYNLEEIIGKSLKFLVGPLTQQEEQKKLRFAIDNNISGNIEVINYKKNGELFWAGISIFPVYDSEGNTTHWVSIQRDITERKKAEEEKEKMLQKLVENNKELTHFSFITSHNLRAPVTNLISICNLIDEKKIEDGFTKQLINGFRQSTQLLNETLNDLMKILIIKEKSNWDKEPIYFQEILNKVKDSISLKLIDKLAVINDDFAESQSVVFSKAYMESVFLNLLTNSLKYSHPQRPPIITVKTMKLQNGNTRLVFTDNGIGMDMKRVKNKIFGLYQRFHGNPDGKGLGLYLIHSQITALGGTIEVESTVNMGTTFTITFK